MARNRLRAIGRILIIFASLIIGFLIGCGIAAAKGKESNSEKIALNENIYISVNKKKNSIKNFFKKLFKKEIE